MRNTPEEIDVNLCKLKEEELGYLEEIVSEVKREKRRNSN